MPALRARGDAVLDPGGKSHEYSYSRAPGGRGSAQLERAFGARPARLRRLALVRALVARGIGLAILPRFAAGDRPG
jgi:DNA-binding transcriptional LysR family regulator